MVYVNLKAALFVAALLAVGITWWWNQRPDVDLVVNGQTAGGEVNVVPVEVPVSADVSATLD